MKINIETIDHNKQVYETSGDYWIDKNGVWQIRVSDMGNWKYEMAVVIHELWEMSLCLERGIPEPEITAFDMKFEEDRLDGNLDEPGDSPDAPYRKEHCSATGIERLFISEIGEDWHKYESTVNNL